jgi:ABC-type polysaccharide/polyol phosphate export permease
MGPQAALFARASARAGGDPEAGADYAATNGTPEAFHAMCEDYRAGAAADLAHDAADADRLIDATFLIELVLVGLFVAGFGPGLSWSAVQYVFVLAGLALLTFGASLLIASAVVFLTDLTYVWSIVTRMLFFLTPVFYPPDMMSHPLAAKVMVFNPLAQLVTLARASLIEGRWVDAGTVAASFAGPFGLTLVGWLVFRRTKPYVPDHI